MKAFRRLWGIEFTVREVTSQSDCALDDVAELIADDDAHGAHAHIAGRLRELRWMVFAEFAS